MVVEIPIAIGPPPIAAASPATPVGIRAPERPETVVKMVWVKAAVRIVHGVTQTADSAIAPRQAMNTEKTNGDSTPPAITSFSPARSCASSPRK